jgi:hypothetical protein
MMFFLAGTKKAKTVRTCLAAITAALLLLILPGTAAGMGLGVSVGLDQQGITITDALRGNTYEKNITIFNPDTEEKTCELSDYGDISGWASYYLPDDPDTAITSVTVPARTEHGVGTRTLTVKITIPADTPNGAYEGQLIISAIAGTGEEGQVGVGMQVPVAVSIEVTGTQIISGQVNNILVDDVEVGYPLRIIVQFQNTGNVAAGPTIETTITYEGDEVDNFSSNGTKVAPGKSGNIEVEWDTTGNAPAEYTAKVVVSLGGEILMEKDLTFNILPLGSLTRSGEITDVTIEGITVVGITCKVKATFKNTGQIDTNVYFTGEVYLGDTFVQVITSDTLLVKRGHEEVLTAYYTPEQGGDLTLKLQANYEGKLSEIKEISLAVKILHDITLTPKPSAETPTGEATTTQATQTSQSSQSSLPIYAAVGAVVVVIAGIFGVGAVRKRKRTGTKKSEKNKIINIGINIGKKIRRIFKK